jgi:hypothetical protein
MRQFLMTDPGGNTLRIGQPVSNDTSLRPVPKETFARALHLADLFADSKQDPAGAARLIDHALAREDEHPTAVQHLRLLVLRGDIARRLGDEPLAGRLLEQAAALPLDAGERESARDALVRLAELRA